MTVLLSTLDEFIHFLRSMEWHGVLNMQMSMSSMSQVTSHFRMKIKYMDVSIWRRRKGVSFGGQRSIWKIHQTRWFLCSCPKNWCSWSSCCWEYWIVMASFYSSIPCLASIILSVFLYKGIERCWVTPYLILILYAGLKVIILLVLSDRYVV